MRTSLRQLGRLVVLPLVVTGLAVRTLRRHHDRKADAELWAAATDAAGTVTTTANGTTAGT